MCVSVWMGVSVCEWVCAHSIGMCPRVFACVVNAELCVSCRQIMLLLCVGGCLYLCVLFSRIHFIWVCQRIIGLTLSSKKRKKERDKNKQKYFLQMMSRRSATTNRNCIKRILFYFLATIHIEATIKETFSNMRVRS